MNKQLSDTLTLSKHTCLETVKGLYQYPFVRPVSVLEGYEYNPGPWAVALFNVKPAELDPDDPSTRIVTIQYCPFCGAPLYPTDEVKSVPGAELKEDNPNVETTKTGPVSTPAKLQANRPKVTG